MEKAEGSAMKVKSTDTLDQHLDKIRDSTAIIDHKKIKMHVVS